MPAVQVVIRTAEHEGGLEYLIFLTVPAAGGDGMLLGAVETHDAAKAIADSLSRLFKMLPVAPRGA